MTDQDSPLPIPLLPSGPTFNYGPLVDAIALAVADRDPRTGALLVPRAGDLPRRVAELKAEIEQLRRDCDAGSVGLQAMKARAAAAGIRNYPITGLWLRTVGDERMKRVQVLVEHGGYWRIAIDEHTAGEIGHIVEVSGLTKLDVLENLNPGLDSGIAPEERGDAKSEADTVLAEIEQAKLTLEDIARAAGMAMWTDGKHARAALVDLVGQLRRLGTHALTEVTHERDSARTERDEARAWIERYRPEIEKLRGRTNEPASLTLAELQAEAARANDAQGVIAFLGGVLARLRKERSIDVSGRSHVLRPGPVSARAAKFINTAFETCAATAWPGRAWFVEVWDEREALTQMYAPWGRPRRR